MYELKPTGQFRKDLRLCERRGCNLQSLKTVLEYLKNNGQVPADYLPHKLVGRNYKGFWECHIQPDWLLVYDVQEAVCLVALVRTGTHSDLFKKSK